MTEHEIRHQPTEISLHRKSRILSITFEDGAKFNLPCEYLRVFSRAAEVVTRGTPETGKEMVNIDGIVPQGSYATRLVFDDGHDTGIYSWDTLYELGEKHEENWRNYLKRLEELGLSRTSDTTGGDVPGIRRVNVLYFAYLPQKLRKEHDNLEIPPTVVDVASLLAFLRKRERERGYLLADDNIRVTVNKQFAEPFTIIVDGDEVGIVPVSPTPPAPPAG